jgi:hypothetical protein
MDWVDLLNGFEFHDNAAFDKKVDPQARSDCLATISNRHVQFAVESQ